VHRSSPRNPIRPLLERRLIIVTGKGGTGKTTVVAALATGAARTGRRVLAVEMQRGEQLHGLLEPGSAAVGYAGREVAPGLHLMRIDPFEALAEYLALQVGVRGVVDLVMRNRAFRQLMMAAPGWRELIILGKIWHLEQMRDANAEPLYDLIIVDAPATGHGVTFLDVPRVVASAVRTGPLRRNSELVEGMIEDPDRTVLLPVSLAEELPTRETAELVARVRDSVGIAVDRVVVNAVTEPPFPSGASDLDERLARLPADLELGGLPTTGVLAACASHLRARFELNREYLAEIGERTGLPVQRLPFLFEGAGTPGAIARLADLLLEAGEVSAA
jgi:anion-transporting  ArsA/GET3 family ATPase